MQGWIVRDLDFESVGATRGLGMTSCNLHLNRPPPHQVWRQKQAAAIVQVREHGGLDQAGRL